MWNPGQTTILQLDLDRPRLFERKRRYPELERLMCAAASNRRFASLLVQNPASALQQFTYGQNLSTSERDMVLSITDARDIHDFAAQLYALVHRGSPFSY